MLLLLGLESFSSFRFSSLRANFKIGTFTLAIDADENPSSRHAGYRSSIWTYAQRRFSRQEGSSGVILDSFFMLSPVGGEGRAIFGFGFRQGGAHVLSDA